MNANHQCARWLLIKARLGTSAVGEIQLGRGGPRVDFGKLVALLFPPVAFRKIESFPQLWKVLGAPMEKELVLLLAELHLSSQGNEMINLVAEVTFPPLEQLVILAAAVRFADYTDSKLKAVVAMTCERMLVALQSTPAVGGEVVLTRSQQVAYCGLKAMAEAQFSSESVPCAIRPRFTALLIGPTGVGKSALIRQIANACGASFVRTSFGEWSPIGGRDAVPTPYAILGALVTSPRVVVLIDELDKATGDHGQVWSRSVLAEVYAVLDRNLPFESFVAQPDAPPITAADLRARAAAGIWLVGAGTWQHHFAPKREVGFGSTCRVGDSDVLDGIDTAQTLPPELLLRFQWPPVVLRYPDAAETESIFDRFGLSSLALEVGATLNAVTHDWTRGGMRTLENLSANLLLRRRELLLHNSCPLDSSDSSP